MSNLNSILGIRYPILQGGMGNISNAQLASAVSEAGGLGTIGTGTMNGDEVEGIILKTKGLTEKPIALNIPISVTGHLKEMVDLVLKYDLEAVSLSAGNPAPLVPIFKERGIKVICVVASAKQAVKAEKAGADIIVAEGYEAAGINSSLETTTLTLIPQITQAVNVPVVAAGGIGDGRGLAAMLALGASGVQMGTRLIATKEAPFHENYKNTLLAADDRGTVIVGRSAGRVRRIMKTPYAETLLKYESDGMAPEDFARVTSEDYHKKGALEGRLDEGFINGGQVSSLIEDIPSVQELFKRMTAEAKEYLAAGAAILD
ncbi:nitronate monooxygenase [Bacillus salacetis]|uniref:Probable nitronate monooxygenase n=1 Tax=Bacillus salacetis TaxID=2315464 RepID=A0A3A1QXC6_9BACI|nr:nitronate monooxygenase [Bacillus salacetis]RIW33268.1 nitronate monooxygenase [Bacillus salacetis]